MYYFAWNNILLLIFSKGFVTERLMSLDVLAFKRLRVEDETISDFHGSSISWRCQHAAILITKRDCALTKKTY